MPPHGPSSPFCHPPPKPPKTKKTSSCRTTRLVAPIMVSVQDPSLASSLRSFQRQRPVHEILGGGILADVILWRRKNVTIGILLGALASLVVFQIAGYTLLSLMSNVLLLFISILFAWAKAAGILNRPRPRIPEMHLSEEMMHKAAVFVRFHVNMALSAFNDIVQGLVIILTVPALYEKYEESVDRYVKLAHMELQMYERVYTLCFCQYFMKAKRWVLVKKKLLADV